jgi:hypothetical protein
MKTKLERIHTIAFTHDLTPDEALRKIVSILQEPEPGLGPHWTKALPAKSGLYWLRALYSLPAVVYLNLEEGELVRIGDAMVYEVRPDLGVWWSEALEPPGGFVVGPTEPS